MSRYPTERVKAVRRVLWPVVLLAVLVWLLAAFIIGRGI